SRTADVNPLRSVGARLSLALAAVVAGALGAVYLFVVPSLERNLVNAKLSQLERLAPRFRAQLLSRPFGVNNPDVIDNAASTANIHLVQRRPLVAGLVALLASLLVGLGGASVFARRIRRLERAADRIAGGRFDEPVDDPTPDELGQLARAFDRMRLRLAQLDRARAEFIANASHELRTPLFALGGFLELLTDEDLDEETRAEFLATMREQVERLTRLAGDLLDLSRLDAGRLRVEREPIELADVARDLVEEFHGLARTGDRSLELELDGAARA